MKRKHTSALLQAVRKSKKELFTRLLVGLAAVAILLGLHLYADAGSVGYKNTATSGVEYETARVLAVLEDNTEENPTYENVRVGSQTLRVQLLTGRYRDDECVITNYLSPFQNYGIYARQGDKLSVRVLTSGVSDYEVRVYNYNRTPWLWIFIALFVLALIIIGGRQGVSAVFGLGLTLCTVIFVLLPLLAQRGWSPIPTTLLLVTLTMFVSFVFIGGLHRKAMVAALGSFGGVLLAGLLAFLAGKIVHINGMNMDEAEVFFSQGVTENGLRVGGLFVCGILISAEGAVMDLSMSVSSAVEEVRRIDPSRTQRQLFRSGMNIGRDAMGTMANTLILAFAGTALNFLLLAYVDDASYTQLMNADFFAIELIRSLAASLGMLLTVPLVALLSSRKRHSGAQG